MPRRAAARIPEWIVFQTTPELALDMVDRALEDGIPGDLMLADAGFGK